MKHYLEQERCVELDDASVGNFENEF